MKRIGIMGGTFNPIHNGHLAIAGGARKAFSLEQVLFMPSGVPYMKDLQEVLPAAVRLEMTDLAIRDTPFFALSKIETETDKNTYTCDTLQRLKALHPDTGYYFILGADSLYAIETWRDPETIFQNCTILAAVREERTDRLMKQAAYLREKYQADIELLDIPWMDVSSTQIRDLLRSGESVHGLVPEVVEAYILKHHLYQS